MVTVNHDGYEHRITPELLQIVRKEDNKTFYSVNRITGEIVITYPTDTLTAKLLNGNIGNINHSMVAYYIPVKFSTINKRPYVQYLGRFRSLFRPEIRFTVGEKALRRINRAIGMKVTSVAWPK